MQSLLKSCVVLALFSVLLTACTQQKVQLDEGSQRIAGISCDAPLNVSTRLSRAIQHCLVDEVVADFLANFPFGERDMYLYIAPDRVENRTDQTTVDAADLAVYVRRQLARAANVTTLQSFSAGDLTATHILSLVVRGERFYEQNGAAEVQYELTFTIEDPFSSAVVGTYLADVRLRRSRR